MYYFTIILLKLLVCLNYGPIFYKIERPNYALV